MGIALMSEEQEQVGSVAVTTAPTVRRARRSRRNHDREVVTPEMLNAPIVTVFRTPDGQVRHGRCHQTLEYHGRRAELELDFYCLRCTEHVTLPELVFPRIPVRLLVETAPA